MKEQATLNQWLSLGVLSAVYISNQWSRSLVFYLVDFTPGASTNFINVDIGAI